jgi:hypothetical protein
MVWVPQLKPKQNITNWFHQHLVGQMLGAKSTTADPILMEVKPRNGIHF